MVCVKFKQCINGNLAVRWMEWGYDLIHRCDGPPSPRGRLNRTHNFAPKSLKNIGSYPHCTPS